MSWHISFCGCSECGTPIVALYRRPCLVRHHIFCIHTGVLNYTVNGKYPLITAIPGAFLSVGITKNL